MTTSDYTPKAPKRPLEQPEDPSKKQKLDQQKIAVPNPFSHTDKPIGIFFSLLELIKSDAQFQQFMADYFLLQDYQQNQTYPTYCIAYREMLEHFKDLSKHRRKEHILMIKMNFYDCNGWETQLIKNSDKYNKNLVEIGNAQKNCIDSVNELLGTEVYQKLCDSFLQKLFNKTFPKDITQLISNFVNERVEAATFWRSPQGFLFIKIGYFIYEQDDLINAVSPDLMPHYQLELPFTVSDDEDEEMQDSPAYIPKSPCYCEDFCNDCDCDCHK